MKNVVVTALLVALLLSLAHAVVAGSPGPVLSPLAVAIGVALVAVVAGFLGQRLAYSNGFAVGVAQAEARAAAIAKAQAAARAQSNVVVNVSPADRVSEGFVELEDSYGEEVELVEDAGEDLAHEHGASVSAPALGRPRTPTVNDAVLVAFEEWAASRLAAQDAAAEATPPAHRN